MGYEKESMLIVMDTNDKGIQSKISHICTKTFSNIIVGRVLLCGLFGGLSVHV